MTLSGFALELTAGLYFILSLLVLLAALKQVRYRLGGKVLGAALSLYALVFALYTPHFLLAGLVLSGLLYGVGLFVHPLALLGLLVHVIAWSLMVGYQLKLGRALPLLDGEVIPDDANPFGAKGPISSEDAKDSRPALAEGSSEDAKDSRPALAEGSSEDAKDSRPALAEGSSEPPDDARVQTPQRGSSGASNTLSATVEASQALALPTSVRWLPMFTLRIPEMRDVRVERGVKYREVGGVRLRLDVYRPRAREGTLPAILYVHGGGWITGTRRQARFMCYQLARAGYVVFAASYRLAPRFPLPAAIEDTKAAVAWIRENAERYSVDPEVVVAIGGSAGGHLTAMLALTPNLPRFQPGFEEADTRVQAAVVFYGVPDFVSAFEGHPNPSLAGILEKLVVRKRYRDDPELFRAIQPMSHVSSEAPPLLLIHGVCDRLVPIRESRAFFARLQAAGVPTLHLMELPYGMHAFDITPVPIQQRTVRIIRQFLRKVLASPSS